MNDYNKYYEKTKHAKQHDIMNKLDSNCLDIDNVIELGCGAGRDAIYLLKKRI